MAVHCVSRSRAPQSYSSVRYHLPTLHSRSTLPVQPSSLSLPPYFSPFAVAAHLTSVSTSIVDIFCLRYDLAVRAAVQRRLYAEYAAANRPTHFSSSVRKKRATSVFVKSGPGARRYTPINCSNVSNSKLGPSLRATGMSSALPRKTPVFSFSHSSLKKKKKTELSREKEHAVAEGETKRLIAVTKRFKSHSISDCYSICNCLLNITRGSTSTIQQPPQRLSTNFLRYIDDKYRHLERRRVLVAISGPSMQMAVYERVRKKTIRS